MSIDGNHVDRKTRKLEMYDRVEKNDHKWKRWPFSGTIEDGLINIIISDLVASINMETGIYSEFDSILA